MLPTLFPLLAFTLSLASLCSPACLNSCGNTTVPYPFGFSEGCPIRVTCNNSTVNLEGYHVSSFSAAGTFNIDVPASCNRSIKTLYSLFGSNYAITSGNVLLFGNCSSNRSDCAIPAAVLNGRIGAPHCDPMLDNFTCYDDRGTGESGFLSREGVMGSGCSTFYSSMAYKVEGVPRQVLSFGLETLEVAWWVEGLCKDWCHQHAACRNVRSPVDGPSRLSCSCLGELEGDGFRNGTGCYKKGSCRCNLSKYLSGDCGGKTRVGVLIAGIVVGAVMMTIVTIIWHYIRRWNAHVRIRKSTKRLLSEASCSIPLFPYREIQKATNNFSESNQLGTGAFGTVYFGTINNGEQVAIKKLRNTAADSIEGVLNEIKLLSSVSHPNLVRILGCCIENDEQILVYEYMRNGTLSQHLQKERGRGLPWTIRLNIATETASAISHLHFALHPPIYHRDIKSSNILLDHNYNSKLADFGLSRVINTESSHISTAPQGTPGYLDPQYHQNFHLSDKSDVYSFGVVLVEIITALKVVDFNRDESEVNLAAFAVNKIGRGRIEEIIDPFLKINRDAWTWSSIHKVAELAFRCLAFHRDMRPSMMEVADELEQMRVSGWAPADGNMVLSRQSSSCSSSSIGSYDKQMSLMNNQFDCGIAHMKEMRGHSPSSTEEPCISVLSSPAVNNMLGHVPR